MKKIMVTGGSGFIGRHLVRELLDRYQDTEIKSVSRSEGAISQLLMKCGDHYSKRLKIIMADIRDRELMAYHMRDVETVIHLAAMKRVDLCEDQCRESVTINVMGTMNLLEFFRGETFILMSTDKAVEPVNCYGATKLVAEKLTLEEAWKKGDKARFMVIRSGNVVGSTGSVMDIWQHQISENNEITVTHPDMLRFYTSVEGVVKLYIAVLERGENGKLYFTPQGDAVVLRELAENAVKLYGDKNTRIRYIGLRQGERMMEKMRTLSEQNTVAGFEETVELSIKNPVPPL
jgi:FlaA1/EpsC-like NDP-sugar epimerase